MFLAKGGGGVEMHVAKLAPRLVERGHQVTVYARRKYCNPCPAVLDGVDLRYTRTIYSKNLEAIVHTATATFDVLFRKVDVIHYHGVGPALLSWIPRLLRPRVTIVTTFHARDQHHQKWNFIGRLALKTGEWMACKVPNATITISHTLQIVARDEYGTEAILIPNGAEIVTHRKHTALKEFGLKKNEFILNVGRILPVKGLHHLIKAFRRTKTDKKLVFVGDAPDDPSYLDELKKLAKGDSRIMFLGRVSGEPVNQLFTHAYLFVQPSESEGLPIVVLEAMSNGTAVLVSDIPGNLEAIHRAGFTFENMNVDDLTVQLKNLLKHPELVEHARHDVKKIIIKNFNWDTIADKTLDVYRSVRH